jgi:hypothetical protein
MAIRKSDAFRRSAKMKLVIKMKAKLISPIKTKEKLEWAWYFRDE